MLLTGRAPSTIPKVSVEDSGVGAEARRDRLPEELKVPQSNNKRGEVVSCGADTLDIDYSIRPRTGTGIWHPWRVFFPRRSILGGYVWGAVWRRTNGRRWLYKKFDRTHAPALVPTEDQGTNN
jgi:hypothetical protein